MSMSACSVRVLVGTSCLMALLGCTEKSPDDEIESGPGGSVAAPICGTGASAAVNAVGEAASTGSAAGGKCTPAIVGRLRDFRDTHPDFERVDRPAEAGIVLFDLALPDRKPVFSNLGTFQTVHAQADFDQWYRDVAGVNMPYQHTLLFTIGDDGRAVYDSSAFFPLDDCGFGNEGRDHNFHFTFELHMTFRYQGGEVFSFRGDDDLWVFVNDRLAIDLGGIHTTLFRELDLDAEAGRLGITPGSEYNLDFFQAERHTFASNFRIETNLAFTNCAPIVIP